MKKQELLDKLGKFEFEEELHVAPKNTHRVYRKGQRRVFVKIFDKSKFYEGELTFNNVFGQHVRVPKILATEENIIIMEYVLTRRDRKIKTAIDDWIRVHEFFLDRRRRRINYPPLKYGQGDITKYLEENPRIYGNKVSQIAQILRRDKVKRIRTLVHGDLCRRNILTDEQGNCYIDFEFSGQGHPAFDMATLAFDYPKHLEWIIDYYTKNISFVYTGLAEDIRRYIIKRGVISIHFLDTNKHMSSESRERSQQHSLKAIDMCLD